MRFPRPPPVNICLLWFLIGLFYFLYLLWLGRLITNGETPLRYDSGNASENDAKKLTSHAFKLFHDHHISTFYSVIWKLGNQTGPGVRGPRLNSDGWSQIYGTDVRVLKFGHFVSLLGWDIKDIYREKRNARAELLFCPLYPSFLAFPFSHQILLTWINKAYNSQMCILTILHFIAGSHLVSLILMDLAVEMMLLWPVERSLI